MVSTYPPPLPAVYRAEYGQTRAEMGLAHSSENRFVLGGVIAATAISAGMWWAYRAAWGMSRGADFDGFALLSPFVLCVCACVHACVRACARGEGRGSRRVVLTLPFWPPLAVVCVCV